MKRLPALCRTYFNKAKERFAQNRQPKLTDPSSPPSRIAIDETLATDLAATTSRQLPGGFPAEEAEDLSSAPHLDETSGGPQAETVEEGIEDRRQQIKSFNPGITSTNNTIRMVERDSVEPTASSQEAFNAPDAGSYDHGADTQYGEDGGSEDVPQWAIDAFADINENADDDIEMDLDPNPTPFDDESTPEPPSTRSSDQEQHSDHRGSASPVHQSREHVAELFRTRRSSSPLFGPFSSDTEKQEEYVPERRHQVADERPILRHTLRCDNCTRLGHRWMHCLLSCNACGKKHPEYFDCQSRGTKRKVDDTDEHEEEVRSRRRVTGSWGDYSGGAR